MNSAAAADDSNSILDGYTSDDVRYDNPYMMEDNNSYPIPERSNVDPELWSDVCPSNPSVDVHFSIDTSTKEAWEKCVSDVKQLRIRLCKLVSELRHHENDAPPVESSNDVSLPDLFELVFGYERSLFGTTFKNELKINKKLYLEFLGTLFLLMAYKEAPSQLYDETSLLKSSALVDQDLYMGLWYEIANKGRVSQVSFVGEPRREECFWSKIERSANACLRRIFLSNDTDGEWISLDDDKIWLEQTGRNAVDNFGVMNTTHNRDNRKGIVAHTAVLEPLITPIHFRFQRQGEHVEENFKAIFRGLFPGNGFGENIPDLNGVTNHSDRGYTSFETIFEFLTPAGCEFTNTIKRRFPNPFIWGMKVGDKDKRTILDEAGCPALFVKEIMNSNQKVSIHAFRTGTKNVSTTISSTIHGMSWEATALSPIQRKLWEEDKEGGLKGFYFQKLKCIDDDEEYFLSNSLEIKQLFNDLIDTKIDIITLSQGTVDWHKGRQFSLTSSQADGAIRKAIVIYQDDIDWCKVGTYLEGENYRQAFGLVANNDVENEEGRENTSTSGDEGTIVIDEEGREDTTMTIQSMIGYFESMNDSLANEDENNEAILIVLDRINNDDNTIDRVIPTDLFSSGKSKTTLRKTITTILLGRIPTNDQQSRVADALLRKWFLASNAERLFMYYSKEALIRIGGQKFNLQLSQNLSIDRLVKRLAEAVHQPGTSVHNGSTQSSPNDEMTIIQAISKAILKRSFMKPLKGKIREHCKMGHKLELPIAIEMMKDLNEGLVLPDLKVISLHGVGLVGKKDCPWAKDSIDLIAVVKKESSSTIELWGLEIKSRQTTNTINGEKNFLQESRRAKYERIQWHDAFSHILKSDERIQILHHAYVYDFKTVGIIIGNKQGKVISGTFIDFNKEGILNPYGNVLKKIKDVTLDWAYHDFGNDEAIKSLQIPDEIVEIANDIPTINGKDALYGTLKLWRQMFHNTKQLPMPVLRKIIPSAHAKWNACKGGSDTITKLVDDCVCKPPKQHANNQSTVICRSISILTATILRLHQICTAKQNLSTETYSSLQHYQNACSQRCTYQQLCRKLYLTCKTEIEKLERREESIVSNLEEDFDRSALRRKRFRGSETIPDHMDFLPPRTFKTPTKTPLKKLIEKGSADPEIVCRAQECTGFPFYLLDDDEDKNSREKKPDVRHRCAHCGSKTAWYCIKCKQFFCMEHKANKRRKEQMYYAKEKKGDQNSEEVTKVYGKSCYHICHPAIVQTLKDGAIALTQDEQSPNN